MTDHDQQDDGDNEPKKGKQGSGKRFNDRQRVEIIQMAENSKISKRQLADKFGVSEAAIRKLLRKKEDFLQRYYDTPEDIRDQRLRGKSTRLVAPDFDSSSSLHAGVTTPTKSSSDDVETKNAYLVEDSWKEGLHTLLTQVMPFLKKFVQSSSSSNHAVKEEVGNMVGVDEVDWIGFSRVLCDIRRGFHRYPETGYQEVCTQAFIKRFCEQALHIPGSNIREMASTGLIVDVCHDNATICTLEKLNLPVIAFRADMDALPIEELNDHLPYCSTQKGGRRELRKRKKRKGSDPKLFVSKQTHEKDQDVASNSNDSATSQLDHASIDVSVEASAANQLPALSNKTIATDEEADGDDTEFQISTAAAHMCGHDGHMTMVLGLCAMVVHKAHYLPQDTFVRFIFQPAEEGPGGAMKMIEEGALVDVDEVYGCHNAPFPLYSIHVRPGAVMAHEVEFSIDINGIGGHGSAPHQCVDPILTGSAVVQALQSVVSRSLSPTDTAVVSVTQFRGGDTNNVIPSHVFLGGTIRDFDLQVAEKVKDRVAKLVHSTCAAYGAMANVHFLDGYAPVINSQIETRQVQQIAMDLGLYASEEGLPLMAAEDFSYFLQERKGCFFFVGTKEDGDLETLRALHSNRYDFNDKAIPIGIRLFMGILNSRTKCELYSLEEMEAFQVAMERILINTTLV
ncbi:metalloprotease family [Plasmopara halstedii]|uniref:Metalloprotease family n=1 Tax=Plasmopara halstedii TaxID=4781 RepID=A0A0P1AIF8_PLAHL|nr:metalloprotease family [Plasmopara halstedii]CEG40292.1 metalloprotease family [Plasmopara halstedii]|eukprot:XP_024576661.1 metalloprotease family [Plasmopara halstedii]